jgi:hypothetical protein
MNTPFQANQFWNDRYGQSAQIGLPSGGPGTAAFCYTTDELTEILAPNFTIQQLTDRAITLAEGAYHHGPAHTVRLVAVKR